MRFRSLRSLWLLIWPPSNCIDRENLWPPILISISCCLKQLSTLDSRWSCMWVLLELQAVQVCGCMPLSSVEILVPSLYSRAHAVYLHGPVSWYVFPLAISWVLYFPLSVACDLYQLLSDDDAVVVPIFISRRILYAMLMITEGMSWSLLTHGHWWDVLISPFLFFFFLHGECDMVWRLRPASQWQRTRMYALEQLINTIFSALLGKDSLFLWYILF